jgi:xanthine dehydrogenase YagR molybdenum-binding subunit
MSTTIARPLGSEASRVEGVEKVTGAARYAFEHRVPDPVFAVPVLSTVARGRVVAVDAARARAQAGVLEVLDHANAPRLRSDASTSADLLILQGPEVRYRGQVVAAVVADSPEAAREGADLIAVRYEEEPHDVLLRRGHPEQYAPETVNAGVAGTVVEGDVEGAFAAADVVVDATYTTAVNHHHPLEPHATVAVWEGGGLTLYNADQGPFMTAGALAPLFGLEPAQVRVVAEHVGGGFGSKVGPRASTVLAALAAQATGRPAKVALTRQQLPSLASHRPPSIQRVRLAADREGRLLAIDHEALTHTARHVEYVDQLLASVRVVYGAGARRTVHRAVRLDVPPPGFMRAPGHASGMFAQEVAIDELAYALGIDPIELRVRNEPDRDPATGMAFSSRNLVGALREGARRFGWEGRDPTPGVRREGRWLLGTGVAAAHHPDSTFPSTAHARVDDDGRFTVEIGAVDIGTGARTALTLVAADTLGVAPADLEIVIGDSASGDAPMAGGSLGTASWGWAVAKACRLLRAELDAHGGVVPPGGLAVTADTADDVAGREPLARHTFGAHFAAVRVDVDSGEIRVDRMLGCFAAGRIVSAKTARSQFLGGMVMGISQALLEKGELDARFGDFANRDLASYHVAANADIGDLQACWLEEEDRSDNPTGAKGIGELGIVGVAPAVANAVFHATGVRARDLPIRIESVRAALAARR